VELARVGKRLVQILNYRGAFREHKAPMLENRNLVPRIQASELLRKGFAAARLNRTAFVVEAKFQQHPMRAHRAAGSDSEQRQVVCHGPFCAEAV
jgi:hypothetical protein